MHVAIDLTNSPHVTLFAPIIRELEHAGHHVTVTARRFAQTVELAEQAGLAPTVIGTHGGASRLGKARRAASRSIHLTRHLRRATTSHGPIDVLVSHGSTDLPIAARRLKAPHVTMFDYEWAVTMHRINCRLSWRVVTPDAIPVARLTPYGCAGRIVQYPGLKESYCIDPTRLDAPGARRSLGLDAHRDIAILRPPPELALYHRGRSSSPFATVLADLAARSDMTTVVLARTPEQRGAIIDNPDHTDALNADRMIVPDHAIDAPSLISDARVVISAGGSMNREAAVLGVPVFTVFAGRPAAVDEALIADGLLNRLPDDPSDIDWSRPTAVDARARERWRARPTSELIDIVLDGIPSAAWQPLS